MGDAAHNALRGLYAITPQAAALEDLFADVAAAVRGGATLLQYRDKDRDAAQRATAARVLRRLCRQAGTRLVINDDLALALAVDADGVHLGANDGDLRAARQALGSGRLLGVSCYADFERARFAVDAGADYVAFGSFFASPTKPLALHAPLPLLARCRRELRVPACAIGGITLDNAPTLLAAGAHLLAVISDLFEASDIAARAAAYRQLFEEQPGGFSQPTTF